MKPEQWTQHVYLDEQSKYGCIVIKCDVATVSLQRRAEQ